MNNWWSQQTVGPQWYTHARSLLSLMFGADWYMISSRASPDVTGPTVCWLHQLLIWFYPLYMIKGFHLYLLTLSKIKTWPESLINLFFIFWSSNAYDIRFLPSVYFITLVGSIYIIIFSKYLNSFRVNY